MKQESMNNEPIESDQDLIIGNDEDLEDFKAHFWPHDKKTLSLYYRMACKKNSLLVVQRTSSIDHVMRVVMLPYKISQKAGGVREAMKSRYFPRQGQIRTLATDPKKLFVFGNLLPKHEGSGFTHPMPVRRKKKKEAECQSASEKNM